MQNAYGSRRAGLTLIELMFALAVLAIALVGILGALFNTMTANDMDRQLQIARDAAMMKLEEARSRDFATLTTVYPAGYTFPVQGLVNGLGRVTLDASVPDPTDPAMITMFVEITWTSQRGQRRFEISDIIGRSLQRTP